jgi:hypothetical protein
MSGPRQAVLDAFLKFTGLYEGSGVPCMYLDVEGIVTCGLGNALFTATQAQALPWRDGGALMGYPLATPEQISDEWQAVHNNVALAHAGWRAAMTVTRLRLSNEVIDAHALAELARMWGILRDGSQMGLRRVGGDFPSCDDAPADAQLGLCSLMWANGPAFGVKFPKFRAAFAAGNYAAYALNAAGTLLPGCCAYEGVDNPNAGGIHNAGVIPRNKANQKLFEAAQRVVDAGGDFDQITGWP